VDGLREFAAAAVVLVALVVIVRGLEDVALAIVVETWAVAARALGDAAADDELDALKDGLERARKAAKKLAKNGLFVGMLSGVV